MDVQQHSAELTLDSSSPDEDLQRRLVETNEPAGYHQLGAVEELAEERAGQSFHVHLAVQVHGSHSRQQQSGQLRVKTLDLIEEYYELYW